MDTCSAGEVVQAKAGPRHSSSRNIICAVASECKMLTLLSFPNTSQGSRALRQHLRSPTSFPAPSFHNRNRENAGTSKAAV